uniref:BTB domain-containing protein n=1 Tax=Plectus sambesii TaxID=2011161 RepID=A0A914WL71_9BILA
MSDISASSSRTVRLNVGGQRFETTVQTLRRLPDTMLGRMFSDDWRPPGDADTFIDRDGRLFHHILNFLRDDHTAALPEDADQLRQLLREAEYYQLCELSEWCRMRLALPMRPIKNGEVVRWRPDSVDTYWRTFALSLIQDGVELGFLFDRVGRKYNDKQTVATCIGCLTRFGLDTITVFDFKIRFEEWEPLKHHMQHMRGIVVELVGQTCCVVQWGNGKRLHIPCTALVPAD